MDVKKFYKSKTFWFNALTLTVLVVGSFGFATFEADPEIAPIAAGVVAMINLVLRWTTDTKIIAWSK